MASTICCISGLWVIILARLTGGLFGVNLVEQLLDAILSGDRVVVLESQLRGPLQAQAGAQLASEERRRPVQRPS